MATGGDDYDALQGGAKRPNTGVLVRDALEKHVAARCAGGAVLDFKLDGRVRRAGARESQRLTPAVSASRLASSAVGIDGSTPAQRASAAPLPPTSAAPGVESPTPARSK